MDAEDIERDEHKRELRREAPRTKRIKTLTLTADGKWEEEEESVEFSEDEESNGPTDTRENVDLLKNERATKNDIPLLWSGNMPALNKAEKDDDSEDSDDSDELMSPWMAKPQVENIDDVEIIEKEQKVQPNASERRHTFSRDRSRSRDSDCRRRTSSAATKAGAVTPSPSELDLPEANSQTDAQTAEEVQGADVDTESTGLHVDLQDDVEEENEIPIQDTRAEADQEILGYAPGQLLAWLLQPTEGVDAQSDGSAEDSDADDVQPEAPPEVQESLSHSSNIDAVPKRMPRGSVRKCLPRPSQAPTNICKPVAASDGCRGCRRKGIRQMPTLRGSVRFCFPTETSCEESNHASPKERVPPPFSLGPQHLDSKLDVEETVAIGVLARHAVRLGVAGPGLEQALTSAIQLVANNGIDTSRWKFLFKRAGMQAYMEEKLRVQQIYNKYGADLRRADEETRQLLPVSVPRHSPVGHGADASPACVLGGMVNLPIPELRFAHDAQREHFGHKASAQCNEGHRSVLQLAVEMLMGLTSPNEVPTFRACPHNGLWYCYTGNRRLAAFRLAHRFAPARFGRLQVPVVPADDVFLKGSKQHQQRLTTGRNGAECQGRWLVFCETGEAVGRTLPGCNEYGFDLLSLLPKLDMPPPVLQAPPSSVPFPTAKASYVPRPTSKASPSTAGSAHNAARRFVGGMPISPDVYKVKADLGAATAGA